MENQMRRCGWVTADPLYIGYHDNEWGKVEKDSQKLFEQLCLEGQQAGLSWITILKKRAEYRRCFYDFDPQKIITITDMEALLKNKGLIRHPLKLKAIINNAYAYLAMQNDGEDFSNFIWQFVNHQPIINNFCRIEDIPTSTPISEKMSKALKQRGFTFVGATTCYAFMQAMGLVNDHVVACFSHQSLANKEEII
jgi:DNA-3-methyladenine glycosylase I